MLGSVVDYLSAFEEKDYQTSLGILTKRIKPDPRASAELLLYLIENPEKTSSNAGLVEFVGESDLENIFQNSLPALGMSRKEAEESGLMIAYITLEDLSQRAPSLFYPHLETLWQKSKEDLEEAWQDCGTIHHAQLVNFLENLPSPEGQEEKFQVYANRNRALRRLEMSNCTQGFELAKKFGAPQETVLSVIDDQWVSVPNIENIYLLENAGVEWRAGQWHQLYTAASYHFRFPEEAFRTRDDFESRFENPSWRLPGNSGEIRFGGEGVAGCTICGKESHHLFTLDVAPPGIPISTPVIFETCLHCMVSNRPMYARHDAAGKPDIWPSYQMFERDYEPEPLPEMNVILAPTPTRFFRQHDGYEQNESRIGGVPDWVQGPEYEQCPVCGKRMQFLSQIHNGLFYINTAIYVFWCNSCRMSAVLNTYT